MHDTALPGLCVGGAPRLPGGTRIGHYSIEDRDVVWTRSVSVNPHLVRIRDGWSINRPLLDQIRADGIDVVRYVDAAAGVAYEVDLDYFEAHAEVFPDFVAPGEDALVLPRARWRQHGKRDSFMLSLFAECSST